MDQKVLIIICSIYGGKEEKWSNTLEAFNKSVKFSALRAAM